MNAVLIVAEHAGGKLNPSTAKCVKAASTLTGAEICVAVFSAPGAGIAAQAAQLAGVARVLEVTHAANAHALAATLAPQVAEVAAPFSHVFGPSTTFGKDLMPRVAALLDAPQVSDIMAIESATRFKRPIYAGNAITTVEVDAGVKIVGTVRTASFEAAATGGSAKVETVESKAELPGHTRFVGLAAAGSDRPDLQSAAKVASGGRALASTHAGR
jgi:electron transfer flavoprotein alpha subunit